MESEDGREPDHEVDARTFAGEGWPLAFQLKLPEATDEDGSRKPTWFNYNLYRGHRNRKPEVHYARNKENSEWIAYYKFLEQPSRILGLDLEWPCGFSDDQAVRLQDRVGVITLASEERIALFHIGAHEGDTPAELIAPSLRKIIESSEFIKVGVNILSADFKRLQRWFGLRPQGAIELSHLHSLVTTPEQKRSECTTKVYSLEKQVKQHLRLPLDKGNHRVRTSNWSRSFLSKEQKLYAANDAYAGLLLYHYLEARRLALSSAPPPPLWHERYEWFEHIPDRQTGLLLHIDSIDREARLVHVMIAADWAAGRRDKVYSKDPDQVARELPAPVEPAETPSTPSTSQRQRLTAMSAHRRHRITATGRARKPDTLLGKLKDHREKIARQRRLEVYQIVKNVALEEMARSKPRSIPEMILLKGMGRKTCNKYGNAFLNIITLHEQQSTTEETGNEVQAGPSIISDPSEESSEDHVDDSQDGQIDHHIAEPSTPPARAPPLLHTGLTSLVERTIILQERGSRDEPIELGDSDSDVIPISPPDRSERQSALSTSGRRQQNDHQGEQSPQLHGIYRYFIPRAGLRRD